MVLSGDLRAGSTVLARRDGSEAGSIGELGLEGRVLEEPVSLMFDLEPLLGSGSSTEAMYFPGGSFSGPGEGRNRSSEGSSKIIPKSRSGESVGAVFSVDHSRTFRSVSSRFRLSLSLKNSRVSSRASLWVGLFIILTILLPNLRLRLLSCSDSSSEELGS